MIEITPGTYINKFNYRKIKIKLISQRLKQKIRDLKKPWGPCFFPLFLNERKNIKP